MQYTAKQGFSFSYPAGWTLGTGSNSIDISDENVPSDDPQAGIKAHWSVEENIPQMVPNGEAEAAPLMADEYTTINGISAFRKAVQVKQGDEVQGETATVTRTMITYQLLKDNTIYRFNCEIDNNNPKELMQICDTIAKSFSFVK